MKKNLLILFVLTFVFGACEGPEGPAGQDGLSFYQEDYDFVVRKGDWRLATDPDGSNPRYYCDLPFPELDRYIYQRGSIIGYRYIDPNDYLFGYTPLTESYPLEEENSTGYYEWSEYYSYICYPGGITFTFRTNDFDGLDFEPEYFLSTQAFRIVLEWQ